MNNGGRYDLNGVFIEHMGQSVTVKTHKLVNGETVRLPEHYSDTQVQRILGEMNQRNEQLPVMRDGHQVGWLPSDFNPDPRFIKRKSYMYDPRPGDFTRVGDTWVASRMMGGGDLEAVPGFVRYYGEQK